MAQGFKGLQFKGASNALAPSVPRMCIRADELETAKTEILQAGQKSSGKISKNLSPLTPLFGLQCAEHKTGTP